MVKVAIEDGMDIFSFVFLLAILVYKKVWINLFDFTVMRRFTTEKCVIR